MIPSSLDDQVVVVTGASSGIGAALVQGLTYRGARVAMLARRGERLKALETMLGADRALGIVTDVRKYAAVRTAIGVVVRTWGRVDVLINNAGIYPAEGPLWQADADEWRQTLETNLLGTFHCMRAVLPVMLRQKYGRIVNLSSPMVAVPGASAYSVSKNAIDCLTSIVSQEVAQPGVDIIINSLDPGPVLTEMNPEGTRAASDVLPTVLKLITLPPDAPSGLKWEV